MRTIDPDRWFSTKPRLQKEFQDVLKACKDKETISFLSVASIAGAKIGKKARHEAAIEYIKTRVLISSAWTTNFQEPLNQFNSAKGECDKRASDAARVKLETARQKLRAQEDVCETQQTSKPAAEVLELVDKIQKTSRDYYFQILAEDAVEKVLGRFVARLLRAVKTKVVFTRKDREKVEFSTMLHPIYSSPRDEEEEERYDVFEDDEENPFGNMFD